MNYNIRLVFALAIVFTIFMFPISASAATNIDEEKNAYSRETIEEYVYSAAQAVICELEDSQSIMLHRIDSIKIMTDFGGEIYYVIELLPIGYMIFHLKAGIFAEISLTSRSPYYGYNENLVYGGPCEYFVKQANSQYSSTISGSLFSFSEDDLSGLRHKLDTINNSITKIEKNGISIRSEDGGGSGGSNTGIQYVRYSDYIRSLRTSTEMGYKDGDLCGWIAVGITLLYLQRTTGKSLIPSSYISNGKFNGSGFTTLLSSYGNSRFAYQIRNGLTQYATEYNKPINTSITIIADPSGTTSVPQKVYHYIRNSQPLILGGRIFPPYGNGTPFWHYVVAYGTSSWGIICHYGWEGYSEVIVNPAFWGDAVVVTAR